MKKENWFINPNKNFLIIFTILTSIGLLLTISAMTDFFNESPFQSKYLLLWFINIFSIIALIKLYNNYSKSK